MTDSHQILDEWLVEGAVGDPPREVAVHAAVCASCARRLGAFDSLAAVDVGAAGSPPPLPVPSRLVLGLAWARLGTAVAGTVVAGILVVFGASQLVGWVGNLDIGPAPSEIAGLLTPGPPDDDGSLNPDPAVEPSFTPEPSGTPIPSFIPLPSLAPNEQPPDPPSAPSLQLSGITAHTMTIRWTDGPGGGPVQKWEIWRRNGQGQWFKLGELGPASHSLTNSGLAASSSYSYRVRAVNVAWLGPFSNVITATTPADPATPPPPSVTPSPSPSIPAPQCADGLDNDADGWTDASDPRCDGPFDDDESPVDPHQCNDGIDNDADGWVDGSDPSCSGDPFGDSESPPNTCNDGIDNDGDHLTDFGEDPSCGGSPTGTEGSFDSFECNDGIDNSDQDGFIDFGGDPECSSWSDNDETNL
jgi:hypothetical protein